MTYLTNKIDFIATVQVKSANPNGDPLQENYPRTDLAGYGLISDVCIKRKIRNRLQDEGFDIFVQSNDKRIDEFQSLQQRYENHFGAKGARDKFTDDEMAKEFCQTWIDTRAFGQVVTYDKRSIGIRGPVSIGIAKSLSPVDITAMQITRSTNGMEADVGKTRSRDTMGSKKYVDFGVYVIYGSINPYFSEKTGFTDEDAEAIKEALRTLFVNDASSARPEGSMAVKDIFWFVHPSKLGVVSSAKIFDLLQAKELDVFDAKAYENYDIHLEQEVVDQLIEKGLEVEHLEGL